MSNVVTFEDLNRMKREILGQSAPASIVKEVAASTKFRRMFNSDMSLGRALTGPQFIDTVAIEDGAVTAEKLVATLVLSTTIIAGEESPGDRITLNGSGMSAHATVNGTPNQQYFTLNSTGWSVGTGSQQISFVNSTGTLSVPAAVITSLTIADVGDGQLGGEYYTGSTSTSLPRLSLSVAGVKMYNAAGAQTVNMNAATGAFTLSSDPSGANRITMSDGGIELWKSSTRQFYLQAGGATNAVEMILTGPSVGQYIGLNPSDGLWLGASTFAGAATKFRVTPAGVLNATSAVISGAITATSGTLQDLSVSGALTITGSGVFRSGATTGARVEMDSSGFYQYGSSGTGTPRARLLATGAGALGISTSYSSGVINWTTAGALTLGGFTVTDSLLASGTGGSYVTVSSGATAFSAGGATPSTAPFRVTNAGAVTATTISASALTITGNATFSGGTLALPNGGSISSATLDINGSGAGAGTMANMRLDGVTTIGTGGSIVDSNGSTWDENGITLASTGTFGDAIVWETSGVAKASIYTGASSLQLEFNSGTPKAGLQITASAVTLSTASFAAALVLSNSTGLSYATASRTAYLADSNGDMRAYRHMMPGNQTSVHMTSAGTHMDIKLSDAAGSSGFRILDSSGSVVWLVNSDGQMSLPGSDLTAVGSLYGRVPVAFNGGTKYIALYNA